MAEQQRNFEAMLAGIGQATEALGRVASQTATQQQQLTEAMQRLTEAASQGAAQAARNSPRSVGGEGAPRAQPSGVPFDTGGKILKPPEVFNPATLEEEVSQWSDWSFAFKNFLAFMDYEFLADLKKAEASTDVLDIEDDIDGFYAASEGRKIRGMKLYSVLSSYLKNRPLKVLRSIDNMDGFEVWRRLTMELEPSSRSRSLAMAQALVGFPAMAKGASLMDYVLTFEKLVNEYEKLSTTKYDDNLKIGTLLKGIPQNLKQHIMVGIQRFENETATVRTKQPNVVC